MNYYIPLAFGGYGIISYYFLRNPQLIHQKKLCRPVKLIAHRGGAAEGLENTLQAYRRAVENGSDMLELDVHLSKDGKAVVAHDNYLQRLTGHPIKITQTTYQSLPPLKPKVSIDFEPGAYYDASSLLQEERSFTTLEDVLKQFAEVQVNIDIKEEDPLLIAEVNRIICKQKAQGRCVWGSFSDVTTQQCYRMNPEVGLFFSAPRLLILLILFYSGVLPFVRLKETHLEIPMLSIFLSDKFSSELSNVSFGKIPNPILRICDFLMLRPSLIEHLSNRGIPTYIWVLNNVVDYKRAFDLGAAGVMTDFPSKLKHYLKKQ